MACPQQFEKEKLVVAVLYRDKEQLAGALNMLAEDFGMIDSVSKSYDFSDGFTSYYDSEMHGSVKRIIISFQRLIDPALLSDIKLRTNQMENDLCIDGYRSVNIDPGLMSHGRFILATAKNGSARIPLADGIYADLTLFYARGDWNKLPWTYTDFQSSYVRTYLKQVREIYMKQRKTNDEEIRE